MIAVALALGSNANAEERQLTKKERHCYAAAVAFLDLPFEEEATLVGDGDLYFPSGSYFYRRVDVVDEWMRLSNITGHKRGFVRDYESFPELIDTEKRMARSAWERKEDRDLEALIKRALDCRLPDKELTS
ncbi:MAG: hypothetical protein AAGI14_06885 [Pseudomonadota bacterium]